MSHYGHLFHYTSDLGSGYERVKVDLAETSFFEGREFRGYIELSIAAGATTVLRFTSPVEFILHGQRLTVDDGKIRFSAKTSGGTEGGMFTAVSAIGKNRMIERRFPYYVGQATLATGGTYTGGTEVEVVRMAASGASGQAATVGGGIADERGLPAGQYYLLFFNYGAGTATGVYDLWWEERAKHPSWK